eukprot:362951-Chlamydomonas_euryale.AAC.2
MLMYGSGGSGRESESEFHGAGAEAESESESEIQGTDPPGYACVKTRKQSKTSCKGSAVKKTGSRRGRPPAKPHQTPPHDPPSCHPRSPHRRSSATKLLWTCKQLLKVERHQLQPSIHPSIHPFVQFYTKVPWLAHH